MEEPVGIVWAVIASTVVLMIIWGVVSSKLRARRLRKRTLELLPEVVDHLQKDKSYNLVLSNGSRFDKVRFVGVSRTDEDPTTSLPFPLQKWIVLERESGKRCFVKPESVRYYEEV